MQSFPSRLWKFRQNKFYFSKLQSYLQKKLKSQKKYNKVEYLFASLAKYCHKSIQAQLVIQKGSKVIQFVKFYIIMRLLNFNFSKKRN